MLEVAAAHSKTSWFDFKPKDLNVNAYRCSIINLMDKSTLTDSPTSNTVKQ